MKTIDQLQDENRELLEMLKSVLTIARVKGTDMDMAHWSKIADAEELIARVDE